MSDDGNSDDDEAALVARILADPDGPEWQKRSEPLAHYAFPYLRWWIESGQIKAKVVEAKAWGKTRVPDGLRLGGHDAHVLAFDTTLLAVKHFPHTGLPTWDPTLGRNLESYFLTFCLMKFPDAYRSWVRREDVQPGRTTSLDAMPAVADIADGAPSAEEIVECRDLFSRVARNALERQVLQMRMDGCSYSDIVGRLRAAGVPMSQRKLRSMFEEFRRRARGEESADE